MSLSRLFGFSRMGILIQGGIVFTLLNPDENRVWFPHNRTTDGLIVWCFYLWYYWHCKWVINSLFGKNTVVLSWGWVGHRIMYFKEQSRDSVVSKGYIHIQKSDIDDVILCIVYWLGNLSTIGKYEFLTGCPAIGWIFGQTVRTPWLINK